jgi:hypothetical protein
MTRRERTEGTLRILERGDLREVSALPASRGLLRSLAAHLNHPAARVRWRAVLALGLAARAFEPSDEAPREILRSLFWSMNDESGNLCRMAPEAAGEILAARPDLAREFGHLLPQYLVEEPFECGTLWALCRMAGAGVLPGLGEAGELAPSFEYPDPRRRGLARRLHRAAGLALPEGKRDGSLTPKPGD